MSNPTVKLLKSAIIVFVFAVIAACGEPSKTDEQYILDAQALYEKKDVKAAIIELKNALQKNGNNAEARALLGRIYIVLGQGAAAEKELDRARELGVAFRDIALSLGDALLYQGKEAELVKEFKVGEFDSAELKAIKTVLIAEAYFQLKSFDGAASYFSEALTSDLVKARALNGQALLALSKGELGQALSLVNKSLEIDGSEPKAWLLLADIRRAQGLSNKAIDAYKRTIGLAHSNQDYFYQVAMRQTINEYLKNNKTELAEEQLAKLKSSFYKQQMPKDPELTHLRAVLAFQKGDYEISAELANNVLGVDKSHAGATLLVGTISAIEGKYEQAEVNLERFLQFVPEHIQARKVLAYVQINNRQQNEALDTLKPLVGEGEKPDVQALALIAKAALRAGEAKQSSLFLKQALEQNPADNDIRLALASSYILQRHFEQALEELSNVEGSQNAILNARLMVAKTYISANDYVSALNVLEELNKEVPDNPLIVSLKGTVALLMGDTDTAKASFKAALELNSGYAPALRSLAVLAVTQGDYESARAYYEEALIVNPNNVHIYHEYASLMFEQGELDQAEVLLKKARELGSNSRATAVHLARMYLRQGKASEALTELRAVKGEGRDPEVTTEIANAQMMLAEYQSALLSYQQAIAGSKNLAVAHYMVATAYMALKDYAQAQDSLARALRENASFIPALIASAEIAMKTKKYRQAEVFIGELESVAPEHQALKLLKADFAMFEQRPEQAVTLYEAIYKQNESIFILQKLVQAYWLIGEQQKALNVLLDANKDHPDIVEITYLLATAYTSNGQIEKAIESYKKIISQNDKHVFALNNLAWLLKDRNPNSALDYAKKAAVLAPADQSIKDTLSEINKRL